MNFWNSKIHKMSKNVHERVLKLVFKPHSLNGVYDLSILSILGTFINYKVKGWF